MEEVDIKKTIANNICELRKTNKLTQVELAEKLNYSDKAISRWERGDTLPDIDVLLKICDLFNVTFDYLISTEDKKEKEKQFTKSQVSNHLVTTLLAISIVWLLATIIFVYSDIIMHITYWKIFVWAVPATAIVAVIANTLWGKKSYSVYLESIMLWSILGSIFIQFLEYKMWMIFLLGIPIEIIIILWSSLRVKKAKSKKK